MSLFVNIAIAAVLSGKVLAGGAPVPGVSVSDGVSIVLTAEDGSYRIESEKEEGFVFISVPSGYRPEGKDKLLPAFWHPLDPDPTRDEVHDFHLTRENQDRCRILLVSDIHLTGADFKPDLETFRKTAAPAIRKYARKAAKEGPVYTFNLGDLTHERYWYQFNYGLPEAVRELRIAKFPGLMYSVAGNHDNDCASRADDTDRFAEHNYRDLLGPMCYSVNIAGTHWIFADDTIYENAPGINKAPAVGSAGSLSYSRGFTPGRMEWIRKDLETLPDGTEVFLCTHCPVLNDNASGCSIPPEQVDSLYKWTRRFGGMGLFCGHMHRLQFLEGAPSRPGLRQLIVPAFSGNMWESAPNRLLGVDGEDAGWVVATVGTGRDISLEYRTILYGEKWLRAYDMNSVRDYYLSDPEIARQLETYPQRADFRKSEYGNRILINCWWLRPGDKVEVLENGKSLKVKKVKDEDPLFNVSYYVAAFQGKHPIAPPQKKVANRHMFAVRASSDDSPVVIRVVSSDGAVLHEETFNRPAVFSPSMK